RLQRARPDLPVIVLTGIDDENLARHSVQFGAQDYLVKGTIDRETLMRSIRHATERKQVEQRLSYLSRHDELTGLANRTSLRERVANAIHRSRRRKEGFGIFLIDMDHFKAVNDRLGHAIGDEVLRVVGSRIQDVVREVDVAARLGGDEFAVLADAPVDPLGAAALAARLRARLREPIRVGGEEVTLTASLGAALYPHDGETLEELVNSADSNMYVAKRDGRDRFVLGEVSDAGNPSLRRAIADQEFVLHYQPQIQLSTHRTVGLEALLRWERSGTLVPPSSFIPLLEEEGLMREVSSWILNAACAHISQVRAHEGPMRVAVNASPCQLRSPDFASEVDAALLRCALPGAALELEVTEAVLTHESPATLQTLNELREIGVRIAIDDFGTGSLTLAGLNQFPVQALKIDRSFVQCLDVPASPDAKLVNAVVSLAQSLDLEVIAEGVETEAQLSQLRRMGCDMAQGFLLGRPSETGLPNGQ
ncbi:MAG: GGDEF domain-containing response regulator, partial [Myxococcota bacterium]